MKAHQKIIREELGGIDADADMFGKWYENIDLSLQNTQVKEINYITAREVIEKYEWIGTMPLPKSCRYMFGIYFDGCLGGVEVFVEPSTRQFNEKYPRKVVQLNRGACIYWTPHNTASYFLSKCFKILRSYGVIAVVAYCTKEAGEWGTIYQSLNFMYDGETAPSKVYYLDGHWVSERTLADKIKWAKNKYPEWVDKFRNLDNKMLEGKLRYIKPIGNKKENKRFTRDYGYKSLPYPSRPLNG